MLMIDDTAQLPRNGEREAVDWRSRISVTKRHDNENWDPNAADSFFTVNSQLRSKLISAPARHQIWNIGNFNHEGYWNIAFDDKRPIYVIGKDGHPYDNIETVDSLVLGRRAVFHSRAGRREWRSVASGDVRTIPGPILRWAIRRDACDAADAGHADNHRSISRNLKLPTANRKIFATRQSPRIDILPWH